MSQLDKLASPPKIRRVPASAVVPYSSSRCFSSSLACFLPPSLKLNVSECKVRRNLFGPIDHESLSNELDNRIKEINDEKKELWGFDFIKGEPIENSSVDWMVINSEVNQEDVPAEESIKPLTFNTKAFAKMEGFKQLPNANSTPENIPTTTEYINSVLNPPPLKKDTRSTPSSSQQKKRLITRTSAKVKCKRRLYSAQPSTSDKNQPSIQSFFKKRKHAVEPQQTKKVDEAPPSTKKQRTIETTQLRSIR